MTLSAQRTILPVLLLLVGSQRLPAQPFEGSTLPARIGSHLLRHEAWISYWRGTHSGKIRREAGKSRLLTMALIEGPSMASFCIKETGQCGMISWSSKGTLHLRNKTSGTFPDTESLTEGARALMDPRRGGRQELAKGDLSVAMTTSTYPDLGMWVARSGQIRLALEDIGSYEQICRRFCRPDPILAKEASVVANGFRAPRCGVGAILVPHTLSSDPFADVLVDFGQPCRPGVLLFRRNLLGDWSHERLVFNPTDVAMVQDKIRGLPSSKLSFE